MTKKNLKALLKPFGIKLEELQYDYGYFGTEELCTEVCPTCGSEEEVKQDGTSTCTDCGHKNIRPCSMCPLNDMSVCDWWSIKGCTPFPNKTSNNLDN